MEQHDYFELSERSYVEFKKNQYYFYSHIPGVKPLILGKDHVKLLLLSFQELQPIVWREKRIIEETLEYNAKQIQAGKPPLSPENKLCYSNTIAKMKCWEIRQQVNKYENKIYIWTKLYVQDKEDPTTYYPCKGGILWPNEDYKSFENFVDYMVINRKPNRWDPPIIYN